MRRRLSPYGFSLVGRRNGNAFKSHSAIVRSHQRPHDPVANGRAGKLQASESVLEGHAGRGLKRPGDHSPGSLDADSQGESAAFYPGQIGRWAMRLVRIRQVESRLETFEIIDKPGMSMVNDGSYIARQVFWLGGAGYEKAETAYWEACCRESQSILELGANIGFFSMHGSKAAPHARYVAVEPNPATMKSLSRNVEINEIENVTLLERAVVGTKETEFVDLHFPDMEPGNMHTGAYLSGGESIHRPSSESVSVAVVEATELFDGVDLAKLDIEGQEHHVLGAAYDLICTNRPVIFVEVRRRTPELRSLILRLVLEEEWTVHALGPDQIHRIYADEIPTIMLQDIYQTRDVVLIPPGREALVEELNAAARSAQ